MRLTMAFLVAVIGAAPLVAQTRQANPTPFGRIVFPGGSGPTAAARPLAGGVTPQGRILFPGGAAPTLIGPSNPLSVNDLPTIRHEPHDRDRPGPGRTPRRSVVPFPVLYGGGYYSYAPPPAEVSPQAYNVNIIGSAPYGGNDSRDAYQPQPYYGNNSDRDPSQAASPVVIINQYFQREEGGEYAPTNTEVINGGNAAVLPTAPQIVPQATDELEEEVEDDLSRLFLIALNDSTIFTASAYWVEQGTLNYLTPSGDHNQVSMDLVNRELSRRLNEERDMTFGLPAE